jgi:hypothetical protein
MLTALLSPLLWLAQQPAAPAATPPTAAAPRTVERVSVLGASLSAGFGLQPEIGAPVWIGDLVHVAIEPPPAQVKNHSSLLFFANPRGMGAEAVQRAQAEDPTLVLALDYLFWFAYGQVETPARRVELLDFGLKQLESFSCPILLGDLPDMRAALDGQPQMLQEGMIPAPEVLEQLNQRLRAWAKARPGVVIFPLSELNARFRKSEEFRLHGNTYFASELPALFQGDKLHTTVAGTIAVWIAAADELVKARKDVPASWFVWDRTELQRRLYASKEEVRKQRLLEKQKQIEKENPPKPPPPPGEDSGKGGKTRG